MFCFVGYHTSQDLANPEALFAKSEEHQNVNVCWPFDGQILTNNRSFPSVKHCTNIYPKQMKMWRGPAIIHFLEPKTTWYSVHSYRTVYPGSSTIGCSKAPLRHYTRFQSTRKSKKYLSDSFHPQLTDYILYILFIMIFVVKWTLFVRK